MANFVGIIDRDPTRRSQFLARVRPRISILPGLDIQSRAHGEFAVAWAAAPTAPVDVDQDESGVGVLWGHARRTETGGRVSAAEYRSSLGSDGSGRPAQWDGYHAFAGYDAARGLRLGADLLGLYPVYYWESGGTFLFGSSESLFACHPGFSPQLNPAGLIGVLLTMNLVGGQTLLAGVRRLGPGCRLARPNGGTAREERHFQVPVSDAFIDLSLDEQADLLAGALSSAVRRHVTPGRPSILSLSGGRDSRMVAGFLHENGLPFSAFTLGLASDIEYRCARRVARQLKIHQQLVEIPFSTYRELAGLAAEWEQLANGFNCIFTWGLTRLLQPRRNTEIVAGYLGDPIVGGSHIGWAYDAKTRASSFETLFTRVNAYGVPPDVLRRLLRSRAHQDLVGDVIQSLRTTYDAYAGHPFQRTLSFDLQHRQRFHTGGNLWPLSFSCWPVVPFVDSEVLRIVYGLPAASLMDRRLQDHILIGRFLSLARQPVDRNCDNDRPLAPRISRLVADRLKREMRRFLPRRTQAGVNRRLFYQRVFDFDNQGWRSVREAVDECRGGLVELFDERVLGELLPPASQAVHLDSPIIGAAPLKTLAGIALWRRSVTAPTGSGAPSIPSRRPDEALAP